MHYSILVDEPKLLNPQITTTTMPSYPNSPKTQQGSSDGPCTELQSIEMTAPSTSQEYESSCTSPVGQISVKSYASDLSSPSIDRVQELSAPEGGIGILQRDFDVSTSISDDDESTVSSLAEEQSEMHPRKKLAPPTAQTDTIDDKEEKVKVAVGWTVQLAETVSHATSSIEGELDLALANAEEAGRNQAKTEEDQLKAQLNAESEAKRLRERLDAMIEESLIHELKLESTQEEMKEKQTLHAREKRELQVKLDSELETIRSERRTLLIRVAALEEENEILCGKLLGDSGLRTDKKSGIMVHVLVALSRKMLQLAHRAKSFRPWTRRRPRGTKM